MPTNSPTTRNKKTKLTNRMRDRVFIMWGYKCHYPNCKLKISKENPLCIHDLTNTGQHTKPKLMRPACMTHHNEATAAANHARARIRKFREQGIKINENPGTLFDEEFYGGPKRN